MLLGENKSNFYICLIKFILVIFVWWVFIFFILWMYVGKFENLDKVGWNIMILFFFVEVIFFFLVLWMIYIGELDCFF